MCQPVVNAARKTHRDQTSMVETCGSLRGKRCRLVSMGNSHEANSIRLTPWHCCEEDGQWSALKVYHSNCLLVARAFYWWNEFRATKEKQIDGCKWPKTTSNNMCLIPEMDTAVLCAFGPGPSLLYPPGQVMLDWLFLPFPKENHALTNCSYCHDTYLTKGNDNKTSTYWHWYLHVYSITLHLECLQHIGTIIPPSPYHHNPGHHRHQHHDHHHYNQHRLYNNKKTTMITLTEIW